MGEGGRHSPVGSGEHGKPTSRGSPQGGVPTLGACVHMWVFLASTGWATSTCCPAILRTDLQKASSPEGQQCPPWGPPALQARLWEDDRGC